jgi:hypothetical protein
MYLFALVKKKVAAFVGDCESLAVWVVQRVYADDDVAFGAHQHPREFTFERRVTDGCA